LLAKSYYHLQNYSKAISTLEWANIPNEDPYSEEALFTSALCYARLFFWDEASRRFALIDISSLQGKSARGLSHSLQRGKVLPKRHPWFAGTLSAVVPGTGYLYSGRPGTALTSFVINSLIFWVLRDAIAQESYGIATTTIFLGSGWYVGNIRGSMRAAEEFNIKNRNRFIDDLLEDVE